MRNSDRRLCRVCGVLQGGKDKGGCNIPCASVVLVVLPMPLGSLVEVFDVFLSVIVMVQESVFWRRFPSLHGARCCTDDCLRVTIIDNRERNLCIAPFATVAIPAVMKHFISVDIIPASG